MERNSIEELKQRLGPPPAGQDHAGVSRDFRMGKDRFLHDVLSVLLTKVEKLEKKVAENKQN